MLALCAVTIDHSAVSSCSVTAVSDRGVDFSILLYKRILFTLWRTVLYTCDSTLTPRTRSDLA